MPSAKDLHELPECIPAPVDDGACDHLPGMRLPPIALPATSGETVELSGLPGRTVLYCYPLTGRPGEDLPQDQREVAERLHLTFELLSDEGLVLVEALGLPTFEAEGMRLIKRLTLVIRDGQIEKVFYPVFPPNKNAEEVMEWLQKEAA